MTWTLVAQIFVLTLLGMVVISWAQVQISAALDAANDRRLKWQTVVDPSIPDYPPTEETR